MKLSTVEEVVSALSRGHCKFYVYGGWGLDGLRGEQTREHRDLDIAIGNNHWLGLTDRLKRYGWKRCERSPNRMEYVRNDDELLDFLRLQRTNHAFSTIKENGKTQVYEKEPRLTRHGNKGRTYYPAELFAHPTLGLVEKLQFSVLPRAALKKDLQFYTDKGDIEFVRKLATDEQMLDRIVYVPREAPLQIYRVDTKTNRMIPLKSRKAF